MLDAFTHCAPNPYFDATDGELLVGGRKVSAIAAESGRTPFYAYGSAVMTRKVQELRAAMPARPTDPLRHEGESDAGRRQALLRAGRWYRRRLSRRDGCGNRCRPLPSPPLPSVQPPWSGSRQRHTEDGAPLLDLAGYVVRYGREPSTLDKSIRLDNAGITSVVAENLIEGTWYFTLSAVNASGVESRPTGSIAKTIS